MPKLITMVAPALVAALGLGAMPAQAHDTGRYTQVRKADIRSDINDLRRSINQAAARRAISPREANSLRAEVRTLQSLYTSYSRNGLSRAEANVLERRVDRIRVALRLERRDSDRRRG